MLLLTVEFYLRASSVELRFVTKFFPQLFVSSSVWSTRMLLFLPAVVARTLPDCIQQFRIISPVAFSNWDYLNCI